MVAIADTAPGTLAQPVMVALSHEVDLTNADSVGEQLATACALRGAMIIADMTATTFCDSTGIRMLVLACHGSSRTRRGRPGPPPEPTVR